MFSRFKLVEILSSSSSSSLESLPSSSSPPPTSSSSSSPSLSSSSTSASSSSSSSSSPTSSSSCHVVMCMVSITDLRCTSIVFRKSSDKEPKEFSKRSGYIQRVDTSALNSVPKRQKKSVVSQHLGDIVGSNDERIWGEST